jgi:hypothetical protein
MDCEPDGSANCDNLTRPCREDIDVNQREPRVLMRCSLAAPAAWPPYDFIGTASFRAAAERAAEGRQLLQRMHWP